MFNVGDSIKIEDTIYTVIATSMNATTLDNIVSASGVATTATHNLTTLSNTDPRLINAVLVSSFVPPSSPATN